MQLRQDPVRLRSQPNIIALTPSELMYSLNPKGILVKFKSFSLLVLLTSIGIIAAAATIWELVNSQFNSGKYYCTYRMSGSSVQKTIISESTCETVLYEN